MDDSDIPMLDVGDFEVLDECASDEDDVDQKSEYDYEYDEPDVEDNNDETNEGLEFGDKECSNLEEENSADNTDTVLDVSIDVTENEFLETVAKDFSENIEDEANDKSPKKTNKDETKAASDKGKNDQELEVVAVIPQKKPGPKSKTLVDSTKKKTPIVITFDDSKESKNSVSKESSGDTQSNNHQKNNYLNKPSVAQTNQGSQNFHKKAMTDEEIMKSCDEIENSALNSDTFVIENDVKEIKEENKEVAETESDGKNVAESSPTENWDEEIEKNAAKKIVKKMVLKREFKENEMWYKDKLEQKEQSVQDKFTKLAKIIQYSYPMYKKWLDKNEALFGTAICKVEPSRFSPLDKLYPNRWKFMCNKKVNQQSSKEGDNSTDKSSENKDNQSEWVIVPGYADANVENAEEYPPFIMRVVKIFEEFLNSLEGSITNAPDIENVPEKIPEESKKSDNVKSPEATKTEISEKEPEKEPLDVKPEDEEGNEEKADKTQASQPETSPTPAVTESEKESPIKEYNRTFSEGVNLLFRSSTQQQIMINVTGKNLKQDFIDKVKTFFETGPGSECNVKSVYCKNIIKKNKKIETENVFLSGTKHLEDLVGDVKVILSPQTNIWPNLHGVNILADVVAEFLVVSKKMTVLDIGCGTGLISLMLATRCQKIIGVDIQKEIKEAQAACELNEIKNATFVTGKPKMVMQEIKHSITNLKAVAVINTNNIFGRSIDVISSLRKMPTLGRIVIITTLTKQAIRSILELTQPADEIHGNPFIPIKACIVDTTPKQFGYEIVMSMERRTMRNLLKVSPVPGVNNTVGLISKSKQQAAALKQQNPGTLPIPQYQPPRLVKNILKKPGFGEAPLKPGLKRPFPDKEFEPNSKKFKGLDKYGQDLRINPLVDKRLRETGGDLRERLSSRTTIMNEIKEQNKLFETVGSKIKGVGNSVDLGTIQKLQEMLNLAIRKTNKLQSQLPPRSVWDRIAPADSEDSKSKNVPSRPDFALKTKKYHNVPPAEPNQILPVDCRPSRLKILPSVVQKPMSGPYQKPGPNRFQANQGPVETSWDRGKPSYSQNESSRSDTRWGRTNSPHTRGPLLRSPPRQMSPPRRPMSPPRRLMSPPRRLMSPPRRPLSPPRRPLSPPRRPLSPPRRPLSPIRRLMSPPRRLMSPPRRPVSPVRRQLSPPRRPISPGFRGGRGNVGRQPSPPRRQHASPPRRAPSPQRFRGASPQRVNRQPSPRRFNDEWDIPSRGSMDNNWMQNRSDMEKPNSWQNNQQPSIQPLLQPNHQSLLQPNHQSLLQSSHQLSHQSLHQKSHQQSHQPSHQSSHQSSHQPSYQSSNQSSHWDKRYQQESSGHSSWDIKKEKPFEPPGSSWDIQKKDAPPLMRDSGRNDMKLEQRNEPRREPIHEPARLDFRSADKDSWDDLPEDARDPWGDDPAPTPPTELRQPWNNQSQIQSNNQSSWSRDKPQLDNWQNKSNFQMSGFSTSNNQNSSMLTSNLMNKPMWNPTQTQQPSMQSQTRPSNWLPPGNWHGASGPLTSSIGSQGGNSGLMSANQMNNWQQPQTQQNLMNFNTRLQNANNAFMNNRR
ncbi:uncharacterized protein LOC106653922 isoform X1 [Trichogramma pretiosum]|uniref:uncharacterized protein LOC106653922 isoform X1 n=1 Tax=Trichogramma pretiosum TaxID=7493 RepID=UPI0006C974FA|nr:uncharacterized protein LOC106653922 isoform X1 [Trichogramma pretiosum]